MEIYEAVLKLDEKELRAALDAGNTAESDSSSTGQNDGAVDFVDEVSSDKDSRTRRKAYNQRP